MPENEANQPMVNLCGGKGKTVGVNGKTMCRLTNCMGRHIVLPL